MKSRGKNVYLKMIYYQLLLISMIYFLFTEVNIVSFRNFAPKTNNINSTICKYVNQSNSE